MADTDYIVRETVDTEFRRRTEIPWPTGDGVLCRQGGALHLVFINQELTWAKHITKSGTYEAVGIFIFRGSNDVGTPVSIKAIFGCDAGVTGDVRVYDVTNSQLIAELTGSTVAYPSLVDLGAIANVPTGEALWELQVRKTAGGGNDNVNASGASVRY